MNDLIQRLRGKYSIGDKGVYEDRDFGSFTPKITSEAADLIEKMTAEIERLRKENEELHCEIAHSTRDTCLVCKKYVLDCKC